MPTYEYTCPSCENTEQHQHKMNESIKCVCMKCYYDKKPSDMKKGFGGGLAVHFKGSGFYETDYKNN